MNECETLCNRLTIMVDGEMKCVGNVQYLKNRYSQGYTVMVKLKNNNTLDVADLKTDMERRFFPDILLKDEHKVSSKNVSVTHNTIKIEKRIKC